MGRQVEGSSRGYKPCTLTCMGHQGHKKGIYTILLRIFFIFSLRAIPFLLFSLFLYLAISFEMLDLTIVPTSFLGISRRLRSPKGFGSFILPLLSFLF
jgi:hypothetical protein